MILCCINDFHFSLVCHEPVLGFPVCWLPQLRLRGRKSLCGRTDGVGKVQEGVFVHVAQVVFLLRIFSDGFGP